MGSPDESHQEDVLSDGDAHSRAMALSTTVAVGNLVELLGATTVAVIGNVKETRAVQQWLSGEREPQRPHVLRFALQLALMIATVASAETAKAWFHGANPQLDDHVPMLMLRDQPLETVQRRLLIAARYFASRPEGASQDASRS